MPDEISYGIVPVRKCKQGWEVLLVQPHYRFWGLPKGHPELDEEPLETATRELKEETNLEVKSIFSHSLLQERYTFRQKNRTIDKQVIYFVAEVEGTVILQKDEMFSSAWIALTKAEDLATYPETKKVLRETVKLLKP